MPRLQTFHLKIKTGDQGPRTVPRYSINGFNIDFDEVAGGTGPGEVLEATGHPASFPHTLILSGPSEGAWEIKEIEAKYEVDGGEPYTIRMGPLTLDQKSDLNIWHPRPPKVLDV